MGAIVAAIEVEGRVVVSLLVAVELVVFGVTSGTRLLIDCRECCRGTVTAVVISSVTF